MKVRDKEFYKKLRSFMIPIAFQNFMLAAVSAGDSAMLGFVDENAMAAVSLAGNVQFVQNLFLSAIGCGGTIMTAQYWGKGDKTTIGRLFGLSLRYAGVISLIFSVVAFAFPEFLMSLFTNETELITLGKDYIRIAAPSYLIIGITQCWLCVMKATGQTKQSATISTFALVLDTVLNAVFIFGFSMGIKGAALTTTIARVVEFVIVLYYTKKMYVKLDFTRVSKQLNFDFIKYSSPILVNALTWGIGTTLYSVIIGHLGSVITTAFSVANIVRQLAISVCQGLGAGGEIMLANVLGSGDMVKAKEYGGRLSRLSVLCGLFCACLALIFGFALYNFMNLSADVRHTLSVMIIISAFYVIALSVNNVVICSIFRAGGDTAFDAYSLIVTMWFIILPAAFAAAFLFKWEPIIVYLILSLDESVKIPWVYAHYKKYKWLNNITRGEVE
ncbi:MAG: MATE family efflux transporter [Lachnospiraceae bacterium]|nr:MATE family efflux transporter [Lachnospiraceae bacterium]